jgi:hypothetical protein
VNTTFRRSVAASLFLVAMFIITSGGIAADLGHRQATIFSSAEQAPSFSPAQPDTQWGGTPHPDHHGDPDDPDKVPPMILFQLFNRLFVLGR